MMKIETRKEIMMFGCNPSNVNQKFIDVEDVQKIRDELIKSNKKKSSNENTFYTKQEFRLLINKAFKGVE